MSAEASTGHGDLAALYNRVMKEKIDFARGVLFVVRLWDGMDGCWCNVSAEVTADEALAVWSERTKGGTEKVSFREIDYFCIFPGGTRMKWDGTEGREMFR